MKRNPVFMALMLVCVLVGVSLAWRRLTEVRYAGRSMDAWFKDLSNPAVSNRARATLIQAGSNAVPFLTERLTNASPWRERYIKTKVLLPLSIAMRLPLAPVDWASRRNAVSILGEIGPDARAAIPNLFHMAFYQLDRVDPLARTAAAAGYDPAVKMIAARTLVKIDPANPEILTKVLDAMSARLFHAPDQALVLLEAVPNPSETNITSILDALYRRNQYFYLESLLSFTTRVVPGGGMGKTFDVLNSQSNTVMALRSQTPSAREAAAFELGDPDREGFNPRRKPGPIRLSEPSIAALVQALESPEDMVRLNAAESLSRLNPKLRPNAGKQVAGALMPNLAGTNSLNRLRTIELLRLGASDSVEALPKLRECETNPIGFISKWAAKAVREIEQASRKENGVEDRQNLQNLRN